MGSVTKFKWAYMCPVKNKLILISCSVKTGTCILKSIEMTPTFSTLHSEHASGRSSDVSCKPDQKSIFVVFTMAEVAQVQKEC